MSKKVHKRFVFLSKFPPPKGGVTVFAERKIARMREMGDDIVAIDLKGYLWLFRAFRWRVTDKNRGWVINSTNIYLLLFSYSLFFMQKTTVYDHNTSGEFREHSMRLMLWRFLMSRAGKIIVVNEKLRDRYIEISDQVVVECPFIPPCVDSEGPVRNQWPAELEAFIRSRSGAIIFTSAWRHVYNSHNQDVYGLLETIEVTRSLRGLGYDVSLIVNIGVGDLNLSVGQREAVLELHRVGGLLVLRFGEDIWPIFKDVDLYVRNTCTDGDSIGIREALHFGCPVVASDVTARPSRVRMYKYGDREDLLKKIIWTLFSTGSPEKSSS